MPRNSRSNEEKRARSALAESMAEFANAHPEPRSAEADIILNRLRAKKDDIGFARAFGRVYDTCDSTIDRMMEAIEIHNGTKAPHHYGAKDYRDDVMAILKTAQAALPNMIEAAKLIASWDPDQDFTANLKRLGDILEYQTGYIDHSLAIMSPPGTHRSAWALRYLVGAIDFYGSGRARATDLARLATVTFDYGISDKAVSAVRGVVKRRSGLRTKAPKPAQT
jgi:hypothetical protein